jgi:hypothetical protein
MCPAEKCSRSKLQQLIDHEGVISALILRLTDECLVTVLSGRHIGSDFRTRGRVLSMHPTEKCSRSELQQLIDHEGVISATILGLMDECLVTVLLGRHISPVLELADEC